MASITQQIKALRPGHSFTTEATRNGIYVAAKRVGIDVQTAKVSDTQTLVTLSPGSLVLSPVQTATNILRELSVEDRLQVFERFELCCGMNRDECICEPERETPEIRLIDDKQAKLDNLRALIAPIESGLTSKVIAPVEDYWINDPDTFENGEILHWHHRPKCKPVCYGRESDLSAA